MRSFLLLIVTVVAATIDAFAVRDGVASESWMKSIKDTVRLCDLVLPGTHDAAAYNADIPLGREFVLTQKSNITEQLLRGIRYVDFRVGICAGTIDKLCMFHGDVYLRLNFDTALDMIQRFLGQYSSETVVMRLQHEHGRGLEDFQGFVETNYLEKDSGLWFKGNATKASGVTVGDVRGKIVLFWSSGVRTSRFGYDYALVNTRENWEFGSIQEMSDVFQQRAVKVTTEHHLLGWFENPTSGLVYWTIFGKRWFSPMAIDKTAKRLLPRVTQILESTPMTKGIVSMDYPTDDFIRTLIRFSLMRSRSAVFDATAWKMGNDDKLLIQIE